MADKREGWFFWASMAVIVIFVILLFFYFAMFKFSLTGFAFEESFANPADSMTAEQVAESFNETFVEYLLYSIKANELHNPPL
ncbi:MAG: hypothetical protein MUF61_02815, partial [archaeon]|nr:hypothetical protein [archaeon]